MLHSPGFLCKLVYQKNINGNKENIKCYHLKPNQTVSPWRKQKTENPLQQSCLENPMDRGARWAIVHEVAKSWTQLSTHTNCLFPLKISSLNKIYPLTVLWLPPPAHLSVLSVGITSSRKPSINSPSHLL